MNLCESITNLCGIREFRERLHCKILITSDINRASGYIMNNPALAPQATMWGQPNSPQKRTTVERLQTQQPRHHIPCSRSSAKESTPNIL